MTCHKIHLLTSCSSVIFVNWQLCEHPSLVLELTEDPLGTTHLLPPADLSSLNVPCRGTTRPVVPLHLASFTQRMPQVHCFKVPSLQPFDGRTPSHCGWLAGGPHLIPAVPWLGARVRAFGWVCALATATYLAVDFLGHRAALCPERPCGPILAAAAPLATHQHAEWFEHRFVAYSVVVCLVGGMSAQILPVFLIALLILLLLKRLLLCFLHHVVCR